MNIFTTNQRQSSDPEPGPSMDAFNRSTDLFRARDSSIDVKVRGEGFDFAAWLPLLSLLVITAVYVVLELTWNLKLLSNLSNTNTTTQELDWMVIEGRFLAAFGIAWALLKTKFFSRADELGGAVAASVLIFGATVLGYAAIGRFYDGLVDSLPAKESLTMYKTTVHRSWAVSGELEDDAAQDPVSVALWPLKVADSTQAEAINKVFDGRASNAASDAAEMARREWPSIRSKLLAASDPGEARKEFQQRYTEYIVMSRQTKSFISGWQQGREAQMEQFTGMRPDPNLTPEGFAILLSGSRMQRDRELGKLYLQTKGGTEDPIVFSKGSFQLFGSDFRNIRTEEDFVQLVSKRAVNELKSKVPTIESVKGRPDSLDVISAAIVPPIAMAMSCIGVLLNIGAFLGLAVMKLPVFMRIPQTIFPLVFAGSALAITPPTASLPGLEGGLSWLSSNHAVASWVLQRVITIEHAWLAIF